MRPGTASIFTPIDGIAQECRTSFELIIIRVGVKVGMRRLYDGDSSRTLSEEDISDVIFLLIRFEYS